jgi:flavin reductase (DIM6/NTAB) family NADH-FMN oxidoreductase RutF
VPRPPSAIGPIPPGEDPDAYDRLRRRVLWSLPTGLFVVGSRLDARRNLMTCNWVMQVATEPKLLAVSVEAGSVTRSLIDDGGSFSVSVLSRADRALVRRFVKPVDDVVVDVDGVAVSLQGEPVHEVGEGLPCLRAAVAWLSCEVRTRQEFEGLVLDGTRAPSHVLFIGEVVAVGESGSHGDAPDVLRMEDTRMNYGG